MNMSIKFNKKTNVMEYHAIDRDGKPLPPAYVCIGFKISKLYKPLEER